MNQWKQIDPLMQRRGEEVLRTLLQSGFEAYFVGGCVRDELMGRPVHDMDIATSAKPEQVIGLFPRTVPTGIQHGTVTVLLGEYAFEVTTFRKESAYEDYRRPTRVEFVDGIFEDLRRRDFTMNAIARNLEGKLTDPFYGRADIQLKLIRCVGDAAERFEEDALRMMRAIRFASVFGFHPVKTLWRALLHGKDKLSFIAMERIRVELEKIVLGPRPLRGLALLERSGLLRYAKSAPPPYFELGTLHLTALEQISPEQPSLRWSLLLQAIGVTGEQTSALLKSWTFPNVTVNETTGIIRFDEAWTEARASITDERRLRRVWIGLQIAYGKSVAELWLRRQTSILRHTHEVANPPEAEMVWLNRAKAWHDEIPVHTIADLAVSGGEILQFSGRKGGPWLGEFMKEQLLAVAAGELPNERQAILDQMKAVVNGDEQK